MATLGSYIPFLGPKKTGKEFVPPPSFQEGKKGTGIFRAQSGLALFREKPEIDLLREDDECLPDEWEVLFDTDTRHEYYFSRRTGQSTWERPVLMQPLVIHKSKTPSEVSMRSRSSHKTIPKKEEARMAYTNADKHRIPLDEGPVYYMDFLGVVSGELRNNRIERPSRQKKPLWRVIRRESGITDQEMEYLLRNPDNPGVPHRNLHVALNKFYETYTNPKDRTMDELMNFLMQFEKESVLQATSICKFDPLDFIDCVRERWNLVDLPCDKTSLNQIATAFTGLISLRDVTDARRVVREETVLMEADPNVHLQANIKTSADLVNKPKK
ncbi:unnamed protein product [Amoebophrya sp. A25]|nr:unnamed protein product [Amoebophrya sp. A25]|eukprot:GSA25T00017538001.1